MRVGGGGLRGVDEEGMCEEGFTFLGGVMVIADLGVMDACESFGP
jgi:hypothetical protein